jgi:hypothetical protein
MSIDLNALATWTYDSSGTLTHVASQQSVVIDIAANFSLHEILRAPHWYTDPQYKTDYSEDPADWLERDIKWNRAQEDPPVLQIEQEIGAQDYVDYTVIELEDAPGYSEILESMAAIDNDGVLNGYTKSHERNYVKKVVQLFQLAGLIAGDTDV